MTGGVVTLFRMPFCHMMFFYALQVSFKIYKAVAEKPDELFRGRLTQNFCICGKMIGTLEE